MIFKMLENNESDLNILKSCFINNDKLKFSEPVAKIFLSDINSFFVVAIDEETNKILGYAFGNLIIKPYNETPTVWVHKLEVMEDAKGKGVGTQLIIELRTFFFYTHPFSDIFFLCFPEQEDIIKCIEASQGFRLEDAMPYFIPNDNVDENNEWKGPPKDNIANIRFYKK